MGEMELSSPSPGNVLSRFTHGQNPVVMLPSLGPRSWLASPILCPLLPCQARSLQKRAAPRSAGGVTAEVEGVDSICGYMLLLRWDGWVDSPGRTHSYLASRLIGEIALGPGPIPSQPHL